MNLSIDSLEKMGAFTGAPVKKEIEWEQGGKQLKADVFVRPLSYLSAVSDIYAVRGKSDVTAGRIASCICDEDGNPVVTADGITGAADPQRGPLNNNLTMALLNAINEVNSLGKTGSLPTTTSSGMSSCSTELEAAPLPKPDNG